MQRCARPALPVIRRPPPPPCTSLTSLPGVLSLRTKKNKSQRPANARHEQMTEMQGQHFPRNRHHRVQKSGVFASKWLQLRSERLNNVRLCSTRPQSQILWQAGCPALTIKSGCPVLTMSGCPALTIRLSSTNHPAFLFPPPPSFVSLHARSAQPTTNQRTGCLADALAAP